MVHGVKPAFARGGGTIVGSTANFLGEIPHILSCFRRSTCTQTAPNRPTSLVEKPQKEFYVYEALRTIQYTRSCQVAGNLRDAIILEP